MADAYNQVYSLVKTIRRIDEDYDDDVVLTLLEQLGTFSSNADFRSLLLQSDVTLSLMKIFVARGQRSTGIAKIVAKSLMNLTFANFNNKLMICRRQEFLDEVKMAMERSDKSVCLQLSRLIGNLAYDENKLLSAPLRDFIPTLCSLMERAFNKNWKRLLVSTIGTLWNLSSHSSANKEAICDHSGAVQLLISVLNEKETELVKNATGVLHYISDQFVLNYFAHKDVIETFDLIPQLTSILLSLRSPRTVLNALAILANLTKCEAYRNMITSNENIFFRLQKLRYASDRAICKASAKLLGKISLQEGPSTPINASFKHVITSTPRSRNRRSRVKREKKLSVAGRTQSVTTLKSNSDNTLSGDTPDLAEISELYSKINKERKPGRAVDKSYGDFEDSNCVRVMEEEVRRCLDTSDQTVVTIVPNQKAVTSDYVSLSDFDEPSAKNVKPKKSPKRFFRRLFRFKF